MFMVKLFHTRQDFGNDCYSLKPDIVWFHSVIYFHFSHTSHKSDKLIKWAIIESAVMLLIDFIDFNLDTRNC